METSWQQLIHNCDEWIRSGQGPRAAAALSEFSISAAPRSSLQPLAHLCYRVGLFHRGLQILTPVVHQKEKFQASATEKELTTYAILLVKIGSTSEAKGILDSLPDSIPEVFLYRAFAEQAVWDYDLAIPYLRKYSAHSQLSKYDRSVAELNLAASLIATGESKESGELLNVLMSRAREEKWTLLYKNLQELLGQWAVIQGDYNEAKRLLKEAVARQHYRNDSLYDFFIDKWTAVVDLRQNPKDRELIKHFQAIRAKAQALPHWESVRDCDRILALTLEDENLLQHVYFGTPYAAYRQKLVREASLWTEAPMTYVWGDNEGQVFDLATATSNQEHLSLKAGQALHRALASLASDRYRPLFVGHLFSNIFPGERFISGFSDARVSAVVSRLRKWIEQNNLPLQIEVRDQLYQLKMTENTPFGLRFTSDVSLKESEAQLASNLLRMQTQLQSSDFTSHEVVEKLKISKSSAVRILRWGVSTGKLIKQGQSKNTKYRFAA